MRAQLLLALLVLTACTQTPTAPSEQTREPPSAPLEAGSADRRFASQMDLAAAYLGRGQGTVALENVRQAIALKPEAPEAYNLRGLIYGSLGETRLAEESFQRALQLNPNDADTRHNYGFLLCQERRFAESETQFRAALAQPRYRDTVRTLFNLGVCQARSGQWADAERSLARSYELDPSNPITAFNLADVLYRRGEYERARFYIGRINAVQEQSNAQSLWMAARIERRLGNVAALQNFGRQLRDRFPQSPEAALYERGRFDE